MYVTKYKKFRKLKPTKENFNKKIHQKLSEWSTMGHRFCKILQKIYVVV
jgi:hypothetical protein